MLYEADDEMTSGTIGGLADAFIFVSGVCEAAVQRQEAHTKKKDK